ncbi:unnamed protein product [Phytophthora fragariaefolia]|uniref:Unnamed protein product n=1 Tax=Phytophthora fragariaefolia TaxID=1490495 RepID=A0A9W6YPD4_9STRA|nr:unnamed protein product [Phytophthora fragariaefolia]
MITSNKTFSVQVASSHKNVEFVCGIPFANTKSGNYATAITTPQYASPFDSAPWTCQPGSSIRDFQVQAGNKNVFQDVHSYDWMTFYDEFSKIVLQGNRSMAHCTSLEVPEPVNPNRSNTTTR